MSWEDNIFKAQKEQEDFIKKSLYSDLEKARSGVYTDTPENKKLGRVGQKYGSREKEETNKEIRVKKFERSKPQDVYKEIDKKKEIRLFRTVYAEDIEGIDFENLGNHWTSNPNYAHVRNYENNLKPEFQTKKRRARITAVFDKIDEDKEATEFSNKNYAKESEVVINKNSTPKYVIVQFDGISDFDRGSFMYISDRYVVSGSKLSSGSRRDKWVDEPIENWRK